MNTSFKRRAAEMTASRNHGKT